MSAPVIEIRTLADFKRVPKDKLEACLEDFRLHLEVSHAFDEIQATLVGAEGFVSACHGGWDVFKWIDDGKHDMNLNVKIGLTK